MNSDEQRKHKTAVETLRADVEGAILELKRMMAGDRSDRTILHKKLEEDLARMASHITGLETDMSRMLNGQSAQFHNELVRMWERLSFSDQFISQSVLTRRTFRQRLTWLLTGHV